MSYKKELKTDSNTKEKPTFSKYDQIVIDHLESECIDKQLWWKNSKRIRDLTKDWPEAVDPRSDLQHEIADKYISSLKGSQFIDRKSE